MVLFPYKADVDFGRWPVMTVIVCIVCVWVFVRQEMSAHARQSALAQYCNHDLTREERLVQRYLDAVDGQHYCDVLLRIHAAPDRSATMRAIADRAKPTAFYRDPKAGSDYVYKTLSDSSRRFERTIPSDLTEQLQYDPADLNLWRMLTAAFSHADWVHLISNLIFFYAFAASVEVIAGHLYYLGFILTSAIGTHLAYSYSMMGTTGALPTVGLSGVVMAMMAFLATVSPRLRIRCVFWFVIIVRVFRVPALAIAGLYIAENIFDYANRDADSTINYVAHISGAAIGVLLGLTYRLTHRRFLRDVLQRT